MSNRVLKKLHGEKDLVSVLGIDGLSESDDGGASQRGAVEKPQNNRFELLNSVDHSLSDTEAKEDDDREVEPVQEGQERNKLEKQDSTHSTDSLKRRKKKKKKKLKSQKSNEETLDPGEDEVEASIREVNKILGEPPPAMQPEDYPGEDHAYCRPSTSEPVRHKPCPSKVFSDPSLLDVDIKNLNPDNEMKKIFGSKVVQNEQAKRRGRGRPHGRATILVSPKVAFHIGKPGLSMSMVGKRGGSQFFVFEHGKQYQAVQHQFLEAVESLNPDNIVNILNMYPYHIDALIQLSDICKMGDDSQMAAELIERAVYYMECSFHPLFNIAQGNCRLDYRRIENRSFFIALFKHVIYVGQRGCYRTALELCKFLLSLDPDDPLGVLLFIDYYALRSQQYEFLIEFFYMWNTSRNLYKLPNFAFSVSLAKYMLCAAEGDKSCTRADEMLCDTLTMFPGILPLMLNKCSVKPDDVVCNSSIFFGRRDPAALVQLYNLYLLRTHNLWKSPDVIYWMERNVKDIIRKVDLGEMELTPPERRNVIYGVSLPKNVLRHIILSNIKDPEITLPPELTSTPIFGFDPLPPADSISPYTRPTRPRNNDDSGVLSLFFRSLLPTFIATPSAGANEGGAAVEERERPDTHDLRRSVTSLIDAMRDLMGNIHLVDVPNEGDVESDDDREA